MSNAVGTVQEFKTKPLKVQAIQFTGKNGKDVVAFIKKNDGAAKNGGTYVHFFTESERITIRKGDWVTVRRDTGELHVFDHMWFRAFHTVSKTHAVL